MDRSDFPRNPGHAIIEIIHRMKISAACLELVGVEVTTLPSLHSVVVIHMFIITNCCKVAQKQTCVDEEKLLPLLPSLVSVLLP